MKKGYPNRIRELREKRKMSGTKLAEMLGVSPQYLYDLEKGERRLNEKLIKRLAQIFNVSADYLLGNDPSGNRTQPDPSTPSWWYRNTPPTEVELEEFLKTVNIYFEGAPLDEEDKEDILTYLKVKWEREKKKREKEKG